MDNKIILKNNLMDITKVLENHKIISFLFAGTLLGIFRDKDMIDGDLDIDIGVVVKDGIDLITWNKVFNNLINLGFTIRRANTTSVVTFDRGFGSDIWWIYKKWDANHIPYYSLLAWSGEFVYPTENFDNLDTIIWNKKSFKIPHNPELYLNNQYGEWKIPNPNFVEPNDSPCYRGRKR